MNSNGTSTRLASLAAAPTFWICRVANSAGGGGSRDRGYRPKSRSSQTEAGGGGVPGQRGAVGRSSSSWNPGGRGLEVSAATRVSTPQGTPPAAIAASRAADFSSNLLGKVGDDQHAVGLGDFFGDGVVLFDRGVLVAQVFLRDGFHVDRQVGQSFLDLSRVGPDLVGHERTVVVGQVHERAEVAADADRVDDRESDLARGKAGQQPEHRRLEDFERGRASLGGRFDQQVGVGGKRL